MKGTTRQNVLLNMNECVWVETFASALTEMTTRSH